MLEPDRLQKIIWRMRVECWIPKATDTLITCGNSCFYTPTNISQTRLNATLYVLPALNVEPEG